MTMTVMVPTLMPPAVEPELPPMNINMMVRSEPLLESVAGSVVKKPAVRAVVALKKEQRSFCPKLYPAYEGLVRSKRRYSQVETKRSALLTMMMTLV